MRGLPGTGQDVFKAGNPREDGSLATLNIEWDRDRGGRWRWEDQERVGGRESGSVAEITEHSWATAGKEPLEDVCGCVIRNLVPVSSERDRKMGNVTWAWTPRAIKVF